MIALDGKAIAGEFEAVWGVAEAPVYMRGPGMVARCRACGDRLIVLVTIRGITCGGLAALEHEV